MSVEQFDTGVPHSARVYDYLLGGKDNFQADRAAAEHALTMLPGLRTSVRANRDFMVRAGRHLAAERGLRQFLDIGTGLPTSPNLHEVAQEVDPSSRVVYVDNDPLVLVHARALLTGAPQGRTAYLEADLRDPEAIFASPQLRGTFDLDAPVGVSLIAVLHFVTDQEKACGIVRDLMAPLASGSALALSVITTDFAPDSAAQGFGSLGAMVTETRPRRRDEVEEFFEGLELIDPGVVPVHRWHPGEASVDLLDHEVHVYAGVGVKP